jgi:hypothetical protein
MMIDRHEQQKMLTWFYKNRTLLQQKYCNQYIAYNANGVLAHDQKLEPVLESAQSTGQVFAIYFIPRRTGAIVVLPIRIRSISRHEWLPNYLVQLKHQQEISVNMLVDSSADFSVISHNLGKNLGLTLADAEQTLPAQGLGGTTDVALRSLTMTIDQHTFSAPVAWLQDNNRIEEILGREVVFDKFNIEFRQAEEQILFSWRDRAVFS